MTNWHCACLVLRHYCAVKYCSDQLCVSGEAHKQQEEIFVSLCFLQTPA